MFMKLPHKYLCKMSFVRKLIDRKGYQKQNALFPGLTDIIILGDLNISLEKNKDLRGYTTDPHWRSRSVVQEWIESGDFTDAYRFLKPEGKQMTWKNLTEPRRIGWTSS